MSFDATARQRVAPGAEKQDMPACLPLVSFLAGHERAVMHHNNLPSETALIADLQSSFPGLSVRPLREFGADGFDYGVWTGVDSAARFADGSPLFVSPCFCADEYDGGIHTGFSAWLDARGWYIENYDGATLFIVPIALAADPEGRA